MRKTALYLLLSFSFPLFSQTYNLDSLLQLLPALKEDTVKANTLVHIANSTRDRMDFITAKKKYDEAIAFAQKIDFKKAVAKAYNGKGYTFYFEAQLDSSLACFKAALNYNTVIRDSGSIASSYSGLGHYYRLKSNYTKALEYYNTAVGLYRRGNNLNGVAIISNNIGNVYHMQGDYANAIIHYSNSMKVKEKLHDKLGRSYALTNIGVINFEQGKYEAAKDVFMEVMKINQELNDKKGLAASLMHMGAILEQQKLYKESIESFKRGLQMRIENKDTMELGFCYMNIGRSYRLQGDVKKALEMHELALTKLKRLNTQRDVLLGYMELGEDHQAAKNWNEAEKAFLTAIRIGKENKEKNGTKNSYYFLTQVYKAKGDYKKAVEAHENFSALTDSIFNDKTSQQILQFNTMYQTEKKDNEIALLKSMEAQRASEEQRKLAFRNMLIVSISSAALLIIGLLVLMNYRKQKRRQREFTYQIITSQEEERKRISKELHDGIGQNLLAIKNMKGDVTQLLDNTIEELRAISRNMHPVQLEKLGFEKAVENIINEAKQNSSILFTYEADKMDELLSPVQKIQLYRIIQECVSNIVKHSKTTSAKITIQKFDNTIVTGILDKGIGFDLKEAMNKNSLGLVSITERVNLIDGKLVMASSKGGTKIAISLKYG